MPMTMKRRIIECALSHPEVDPPITTFLIFVPHEPTHNPPNQLFSCTAGSKVNLMTKLALERMYPLFTYYIGKYSQIQQNTVTLQKQFRSAPTYHVSSSH